MSATGNLKQNTIRRITPMGYSSLRLTWEDLDKCEVIVDTLKKQLVGKNRLNKMNKES